VRARKIGRTGIELTELGFGAGGLGDFRMRIPDHQAEETVAAMWQGGVRFFDTAPAYGRGLSELRLGQYLRRHDRGDFVLATKVGRVLSAPPDPANWTGGRWAGGLPFDATVDFSREGVLRAFEDSLQRLGLNRVDIIILHDLNSAVYDDATLATQWCSLKRSGWDALDELRACGRIQALGLGIKVLGEIPRFLETFRLDLVYIVGSYTLIDQAAFPEIFDLCERHGVDVVLAGALYSGILAQGPVDGATFDYRRAQPDELERVARLDALCRTYDVPLQAVAIQFPLAHPAVRSVLVGPVSATEAHQNLRAYEWEIPASLWRDLRDEGWIRADAPVPG
jgi:D-threo-aldose 1-dehydrogenase